jgi:cyclophilin family peptidyl-prolyl cis-trans isomerase
VRLLGAEAPMTAMNFVDLARKSFFDGIAIHRVVPDFVVQDGDPTGTGNGGPGYEIRDENDAVPYGTGTVGMALAGPDTGGSQWFVTHAPQPHLDGIYTVFGQVVAGQEVVERLEQWDRITRVTVSEGP